MYELKCNITVEVNHLTEGIRLGLQDDREKNSEKLGRLALFAVSPPETALTCRSQASASGAAPLLSSKHLLM